MTDDSLVETDGGLETPERTIVMRWRDLDAYGHVNNAVYQTYLEEARDAAIRHALRSVTDHFDHVLARVAIDFRRELHLDDSPLRVACRVVSFGRSSLRTRETIRAADGTLAADAEAVVVAIDRTTRHSRPLTEAERAALRSGGALSHESSESRQTGATDGEET